MKITFTYNPYSKKAFTPRNKRGCPKGSKCNSGLIGKLMLIFSLFFENNIFSYFSSSFFAEFSEKCKRMIIHSNLLFSDKYVFCIGDSQLKPATSLALLMFTVKLLLSVTHLHTSAEKSVNI